MLQIPNWKKLPLRISLVKVLRRMLTFNIKLNNKNKREILFQISIISPFLSMRYIWIKYTYRGCIREIDYGFHRSFHRSFLWNIKYEKHWRSSVSFTSQLQRTIPSGETPVCLISAMKLSRWVRVFLSLSKFAIDFLIHMFLGTGTLSSCFSSIQNEMRRNFLDWKGKSV